jgi:hypothetical protein
LLDGDSGNVLIYGERQRCPVRLSGNSWFVLEGFNACRASGLVTSAIEQLFEPARPNFEWIEGPAGDSRKSLSVSR